MDTAKQKEQSPYFRIVCFLEDKTPKNAQHRES